MTVKYFKPEATKVPKHEQLLEEKEVENLIKVYPEQKGMIPDLKWFFNFW